MSNNSQQKRRGRPHRLPKKPRKASPKAFSSHVQRTQRFAKLQPLYPSSETEKVQPDKLVLITHSDVQKMITSALNKDREAKYLISGATNVFGTAAYTYSSVVDVPQGTGDSARIGDVLEPARLHFVIHLVRNPATSNVDEVIRIVIFQWRPQFSLQPPTSAVLWKNDPIASAVTPFSEWIKDARSSFIVLYDRRFVMTGLTATTEGARVITFHVNLRRALKQLQYVAGSTTDATNKIFIGTCSSTATTPPVLTWRAQFSYWDA